MNDKLPEVVNSLYDAISGFGYIGIPFITEFRESVIYAFPDVTKVYQSVLKNSKGF